MTVAAHIIHGAMKLMGKLPLKFHYACSDVLCFFLRDVFRYRRDVVLTNLSRSFPDMSYGEIKKVASDFYRHLADIFVETIWYAGCGGSFDRVYRSGIVRAVDSPAFAQAGQNQRGVLVVMSHCGNWELTSSLLGAGSYPKPEDLFFKPENSYVVYKKLSSKTWDEVLVANRISPIRDYTGQTESMDILRVMLKNRGRNCVYVFPSDQAPYKNTAGYTVGSFLNQKTDGMLGGFAAAHKLGLSVIYMKFARAGRGHYEVSFETLSEDASLEDPQDTMIKYYKALECTINEDPANWLWTHKRWKKSRNHKETRNEE